MNQGADLWAARVALGLTRQQMAGVAGLTDRSIYAVEHGKVEGRALDLVTSAVLSLGVQLERPGFVYLPGGRVAPTVAAVGKLSGRRLHRARWRLAWSQRELATRAVVSTRLVRGAEASAWLNETPDFGVYRMVAALQEAGTIFAPWKKGGNIGDRCLVPRPKRRQDYAVGAAQRPVGPHGMDFEADG